MTQVEWLRKRRDRIQVIADKVAEKTLSTALPLDRYLVNVGRYQQLKALVTWFETEIEKIRGGDEEPTVDEHGIGVTDMDDEDFRPPAPRGDKPVQRQRRPREWGG